MSPGRSWALHFVSGRYEGGEYPLRVDGEVVIGRAGDLDMVLEEDMVSRKHARLLLSPGGITLEDLGSTNGTFVNGEKIKQAQLHEGDRILIGTSILKLVGTAAPPPAEGSASPQEQLVRSAAAQERPAGRSTVQGRLEEVPLVDLLQLLSTSKKSGAIVLRGLRQGRVQLRAGRAVSASIDGDGQPAPKKALFRMVGWTQGSFEFVPRDGEMEPSPEDFSEGTEQLVMEAMHEQDEIGRGGLPPPTAALGLTTPLQAPLRALGPDELDLLQLALNYGVVQAVLDRGVGSDLEIARKLASLLQRGYLRQF